VDAEHTPQHLPVMPREVLAYLDPQPGATIVDCTAGAGGHLRLIAEAMGRGRIVGLDRDPVALALAGAQSLPAGVRVDLLHSDFRHTGERLRELGIEQVDGVMADLGVSSMQLSTAQRGFSFAADGPLDMRMDPRQPLTAHEVVNQFDERTLADLIFQFGEERRSRRIARAIVRSRPLHTTAQLAGVVAAVSRSVNPKGRRGLHPATRTFQALRIVVNAEIDALTDWLTLLPTWLRPGGRAVVISFHSLEDRPVKQSFRAGADQGVYELLTRRTVRPSEDEMARNPRSRSAKLRAVRRLAV